MVVIVVVAVRVGIVVSKSVVVSAAVVSAVPVLRDSGGVEVLVVVWRSGQMTSGGRWGEKLR
jgi:hypothetical protein